MRPALTGRPSSCGRRAATSWGRRCVRLSWAFPHTTCTQHTCALPEPLNPRQPITQRACAWQVLLAKASRHLAAKEVEAAVEVYKALERRGAAAIPAAAATNLSFLYLLEGDLAAAAHYTDLALKADRCVWEQCVWIAGGFCLLRETLRQHSCCGMCSGTTRRHTSTAAWCCWRPAAWRRRCRPFLTRPRFSRCACRRCTTWGE